MTRTPALLLLATTLLFGCAAPADAPPETLEAAAWPGTARVHRFGDIYLASQPAAADLELAAEQGFRTVACQRRLQEPIGFDEQGLVEELGLVWSNPAFGGSEELTDALLDETIALFREAERPLLVHCGSANRTGATWFAYRVVVGGLDVETALAEAKQVGLRSAEYEAVVRDYLARRP